MVFVYLSLVPEMLMLCTHDTFLSKCVLAIAFGTPQHLQRAWMRAFVSRVSQMKILGARIICRATLTNPLDGTILLFLRRCLLRLKCTQEMVVFINLLFNSIFGPVF